MKTHALTFALAVSTLAFMLSAQAHDPKEHMNNAEKPNCSAINNSDHNNMDMDDPIMQAMMKQCGQAMHDHDEKGEEASPGDAKKTPNDHHSKHQH